MNKKKALALLAEYLDEYDDRFIFHEQFVQELIKIATTELKGNENEFFKLFVKQLKFIDSKRERIDEADSNEKLRHFPKGDWYSIHVSTKVVNVRLLIRFLLDHSPVFLVCFNEKSGKRSSGYEQYKEVVVNRFKEIEEEWENE